MKIVVDFDRCESNGVCEDVAPEVFWIDDDEFLQIRTENVNEDHREALQEAVKMCPRAAITLEEGA